MYNCIPYLADSAITSRRNSLMCLSDALIIALACKSVVTEVEPSWIESLLSAGTAPERSITTVKSTQIVISSCFPLIFIFDSCISIQVHYQVFIRALEKFS